MKTRIACVCLLLAGILAAGDALGRVKLTTLPVRERVEIQLDNPNATLVEEERIVTLLAGINHIDFSWSSASIDKGTIQFRVVDMPLRPKRPTDSRLVVRPDGRVERIQVLNVAYPPGENALVWEVFAEQGFAARVRVSYLIANLQRSFSYRAIAEPDESTLVLKKYLKVGNFSSEEFGLSNVWAGFGTYFHDRFIGMNEAKEMLIARLPDVPIRKTYLFDWWTGKAVPDEPDQRYVEMRYVLTNDEHNHMGIFPLQYGKVRIFQKDGHGGDAFIGENWGDFTPVGAQMRLYLGLARDVVVNRTVTHNVRHPRQGDLFDQELVLEYRIENFKKDAVTLDIREDLDRLRDQFCGNEERAPQWDVVPEGTTLGRQQVERIDSRTLELHVPLVARPEGDAQVKLVTVAVHLVFKNEW